MKKFFNENLKPTMEWIVKDSDPRIRNVSNYFDINNITNEDIKHIQMMTRYIDVCYEGKEHKYKIESGIGISGVQIGYLKRVCYIHLFDDYYEKEFQLLFANPEILEVSRDISYLECGEGCLSVPERREGVVPRKYWIKIQYFDLFTFSYKEEVFYDFLAIVIQHEIDHMNGKLYYDHINIFYPFNVSEDWKKIK